MSNGFPYFFISVILRLEFLQDSAQKTSMNSCRQFEQS